MVGFPPLSAVSGFPRATGPAPAGDGGNVLVNVSGFTNSGPGSSFPTNAIVVTSAVGAAGTLLVVVSFENAAGQVSVASVTQSGLIFVRRAATSYNANNNGRIECWYATAVSAGTYTPTITFTGAFDTASAIWACLYSSTGHPVRFDPNAAVPGLSAAGNFSNMVRPVSTNSVNPWVLAVGGLWVWQAGIGPGSGGVTPAAGGTLLQSSSANVGNNPAFSSAYYWTPRAAVSSANYGMSDSYNLYTDALISQ